MPWTYLPLSPPFDPTKIRYLNELVVAIRARQRVLTQPLMSLPFLTENCHSAATFRSLQNWVETNCSSFVRSHDLSGGVPVLRDITSYGNTALETWSWSTLKTVAQIPNGWTAVTAAGSTVYRQAAQYDRVDSHLYNDLYRAIRLLQWRAYPISALGVLYFRWAADGNAVGEDVVGPATRPTTIVVPTGATQVTVGHNGTWSIGSGFDSYTPSTWESLLYSVYPSAAYRSAALNSQNIELIAGQRAGALTGFFATTSSAGPYSLIYYITNGRVLPVTGSELTLGMINDYWYTGSGTVNAILAWNTLD